MSPIKIKINQVNNLTDARYFAAAGVDFLGFDCNIGSESFCPLSKIFEIKQWVEGPKFVLEFDGWQSEDEITNIIPNDGFGCHFGAFSHFQILTVNPVFKDYLIEEIERSEFANIDFPVIRSEKTPEQFTSAEIGVIRRIQSEKTVFFDSNFASQDFEKIIEMFPGAGFILRGGNEDRPGFKSFEELDAIFEALEHLAEW
jgi:phosphoribosylanthranilate isomerase